MNHVYAQNFHPANLQERVRDVSFYRRPRTLFKGFKVPDWAQASKMNGWEVDAYSRAAWDKAMHEFNSEWTPMQFFGERQEPNVLQWFRMEQGGKGTGSRLFYNEVPHPYWIRHNGHMENPEDILYSFTHGDQEQPYTFGIDTTTEEGRIAYKAEYDAIAEMVPEIIKKEAMLYPHEMPKPLSQEAHFQRVWQLYRNTTLQHRILSCVDTGAISLETAKAAAKFLGSGNQMSISSYLLAKNGLRKDLTADKGFLATAACFKAIGFIPKLSTVTAEPMESQFWMHFDHRFSLTEIGMKEALPVMIQDKSNRARAEAIIEEKTQHLTA